MRGKRLRETPATSERRPQNTGNAAMGCGGPARDGIRHESRSAALARLKSETLRRVCPFARGIGGGVAR